MGRVFAGARWWAGVAVLGAALAGSEGSAPAVVGTAARPADRAIRSQGAASAPAQARALSRLRDDLGRSGFVATDAGTGGVRSAGRFDGFLTGPSGGSPREIALAWVRDHLPALDLRAADLRDLAVAREYRSIDGVTHLIFEQRVDGVPLVGSDLRANVTDDGRLVSVGGGARGGLSLGSATPRVSARGAYARVLRSIDSRADAPAVRSQTGRLRRTDFAGSGTAGLVAYGAGSEARLAWRAVVPAAHDQAYDALVDARTGDVVRRANLVKFATALVHENHPGAPAGGAQVARPIDSWLSPGATTLTGENAHAFGDVDDAVGTEVSPDRVVDHFEEAVPPAAEVGPSAGSDWLYPLNPVADPDGLCPAAPGCTWHHTTPNSWQANARQATTQLFYFVNTFHDHLAAPPIGFDEASGNFERANSSGQGRGGDPVLAQANDGAATAGGLPDGGHRNNANFDTRPDGLPGRMQMYLFQPITLDPGPPPAIIPFSSVNGSDDPQIVYHEYAHGLSNRLITDAQGFGALSSAQAGAMGEAWSDWYALDLLSAEGLQGDEPGPGDVVMGAYVDGGSNLIRSEPVDCRPGDAAAVCPGGPATGPGGYTYGDFGKVVGFGATLTLPEVHADGEIWAQTLWQLRAELVARHGLAGGSRRAEQIVTGGMRLGPGQPTFLDQRNAILQADAVAANGDQDLIWKVFAARGMGYFASTSGEQDVRTQEDFSLPPGADEPTGTIQGTVRDDGDRPVAGVRVALGGHDAPVVGPALQAVTGADGTYAVSGVPQGQYGDLVADAPAGFADASSGPVTVAAAAVTRDLTVRRNYADAGAGATVPGFSAASGDRPPPDPRWSNFRDESAWGCGPEKLFDGDQGTAVGTSAPTGTDDPGTAFDETAPRYVTVELSQPVAAADIWLDPTARCGGLDGNALGAYAVSVSADGATFTEISRGAFGAPDLHRLNRVPLNLGTPVPAGIRYVRLTALRSLGGPDEGGDPLSDGGFMSIADLHVYERPRVAPAPPAPPAGAPSPSPAPSLVPSPAPSLPPSPAPSPAPSTGAAPAPLRPDLSRAARRLRVSRTGAVAVRAGCVAATPSTAPARCRAALSLRARLPGRRRTSTLASRTVSVVAGRPVTVRLTLRRQARDALRDRSLRATLRLTIRASGTAARSVSRTVLVLRRR